MCQTIANINNIKARSSGPSGALVHTLLLIIRKDDICMHTFISALNGFTHCAVTEYTCHLTYRCTLLPEEGSPHRSQPAATGRGVM